MLATPTSGVEPCGRWLAETAADERPDARRRILFAKLGSFSYINEQVGRQLTIHFPKHEISIFDVKHYIRRRYGTVAWNAFVEILTYGPSVLFNASDRHAFFFFTSFMFRSISAAIVNQFGAGARAFDFVLQTQGLFNATLPGRPLLIYTDYTVMNNADEPGGDQRLFRSKGFLRQEAALYRNAAAVATTGRHVERTLLRHYGCDPTRVSTVHIGANVDMDRASNDRADHDNKRILFVGVDWERKGGPGLVEAFSEIAHEFPEVRLTIVGCSPAISHPRIDVAGRVPREQMAAYFQAASIFCMPSLIEPLGIATIEASLFRLPVIATRIGGFFETVTDGETGILVPPNNPRLLAEAMRRLLRDPELAVRMGDAGYRRNRVLFDWDAVGKRIRDIATSIAPGLVEAA